MNKPPDNEELKRECSYPCGIHSVPTLDHNMYDGAKKIRDQWKAANESMVERLIDLHMKLNLATTPEAMTEIRNEVKELIKELTASESKPELE